MSKEYPGVLTRHKVLHQTFHKVGESAFDKEPLPIYSDMIEGFAEVLKRNIKAKRQNVVVVTGATGSGKSVFAIKLAMAIDPDFSFKNDYIYSAKDLVTKLKKDRTQVSPVSLFDEGSIILNSKNFARSEDKLIENLFNTMRSRGWTTIICIPDFNALNKSVRTTHVNFRVSCGRAPLPGYQGRGFAKLFKYSKVSEFTDVYWKPLCWGIYTDLRKKVKEVYEARKAESQDKFIDVLTTTIGDEE